jgi:hypothetical protein
MEKDNKKPPRPLGKNNCKTCNGYGLWAFGDPSPMGYLDHYTMPTIPCPECKANSNPVTK